MNKILTIIYNIQDKNLQDTLIKGLFTIYENNLFLLKQTLFPIKPLGDFSSLIKMTTMSNNSAIFNDASSQNNKNIKKTFNF